MEAETTFMILLFVVATAVAIAVRRLEVLYTVALVFTGLILGLLHIFEASHLTKALLFGVFLPRLLIEVAFHIWFNQFWRNRFAITLLALPGIMLAIALPATVRNRQSPTAGLSSMGDFPATRMGGTLSTNWKLPGIIPCSLQ